jgi:hypothetical protein
LTFFSLPFKGRVGMGMVLIFDESARTILTQTLVPVSSALPEIVVCCSRAA